MFPDSLTIHMPHEYGGDADIDIERGPLAGRLEGDYKSFDFHFFAVNLIWRFGGPVD